MCIRDRYNRLQQSNNPGNDPVTSYCNVLDSILDTYYNNFDFFHQTSPCLLYTSSGHHQTYLRYFRFRLGHNALKPAFIQDADPVAELQDLFQLGRDIKDCGAFVSRFQHRIKYKMCRVDKMCIRDRACRALAMAV